MDSTTQDTKSAEYITPKEIGNRLGIHMNTVYWLLKSGEIPTLRLRYQFRIRTADFDYWLRSRTHQ